MLDNKWNFRDSNIFFLLVANRGGKKIVFRRKENCKFHFTNDICQEREKRFDLCFTITSFVFHYSEYIGMISTLMPYRMITGLQSEMSFRGKNAGK